MPDTTYPALIVPIHLDGICLGNKDTVIDGKSPLASPSASFDIMQNVGSTGGILPKNAEPYLSGAQLVETFGQASCSKSGIYLHWAFPSALTQGNTVWRIPNSTLLNLRHQGFDPSKIQALSQLKGQVFTDLAKFQQAVAQAYQLSPGQTLWYQPWIDQVAARFDFPALPNRWVIVRTQKDGDTPKAWLIESDYLSAKNLYADSEEFMRSAEILSPFPPPVDQKNGKPFYRLMGRVKALGQSWPADKNPEYHPQLTVLGYGSPDFAGYLMNSQHVFGFYDAAQDAPAGEYNYMVAGWYSDQSLDKDPFYNKTAEQAQQLLRTNNWALPDGTGNTGLSRSYYSGGLSGVQWDPERAYFKSPKVAGDSIKIVLANTTAEALSAYVAAGKTFQQADPDGRKAGLLPEEALTALQMGLLPTLSQAAEKEAVFQEATHSAAFAREQKGYCWQITPLQPDTDNTPSFAQQAGDKKINRPLLPESVAQALNALNVLQSDYDRRLRELESRRQALFAAWFWYSRWNLANDAKIKEQANSLDQNINSPVYMAFDWQQWETDFSKDDTMSQILPPDINLSYQEAQLWGIFQKIEAALQQLHELFQQNNLSEHYQISLLPAARFYHPNDPVLLIADEKGQISPRVNRPEDAGPLGCRLLKDTSASPPLLPAGIDSDLASDVLNKINSLLGDANMAVTPWGNENSWHPILLQYELEYYSLSPAGDYPADFVTANQDLDPNHIDLKFKPAATAELPPPLTFSGTVVLSHQAASTMTQQLASLQAFPDSDNPWKSDLDAWVTPSGIADIPLMSQAINGFHDHLLARLRTLKLPVYDPYDHNWQDPDNSTWGQVARGVGRFQPPIPNELDEAKVQGKTFFNPLRNGFVAIKQIRLIDAFGQYRDIDLTAANILQPLNLQPENRSLDGKFPPVNIIGNQDKLFCLPPRIVQSSRLNFDWLSAANDTVEVNTHPASSPVCGWVMPNHLDGSLIIYDPAGQHLGALQTYADGNEKVLWMPARMTSGETPPPTPDQIGNPHLKAFVTGFLSETAQNFNAFRSAIDRVLLTIEPSGYRQHNARAVLFGRPLALAQVSLELELKGLPVQDWSEIAFGNQVDQFKDGEPMPELPDQGFHKVQFPVRLGDLSLLNDGLVGYFPYNAQQKAYTISEGVFQAEDQTNALLLSPSGGPVRLLMLIDPRAEVHATTGILPVESIEIPPDQYKDAMENLEFSFLVNPVLSPQDQLRFPLPAETDGKWSFLGGDAKKYNPQPSNTSAAFYDKMPAFYEGWLKIGVDEKSESANK